MGFLYGKITYLGAALIIVDGILKKNLSLVGLGISIIGLRFALHKNMGIVIDKRGVMRMGKG